MDNDKLNGAESLVHTLAASGVTMCFANPGTSEMHFVAALDRIAGPRCVLWLFEGVVTGAADGYYRMSGQPAATLLHEPDATSDEDPARVLAKARIEAHYFRHNAFLAHGQLLRDIDRIRHLPGVIVQGRYDVVCPMMTAWALHRAWPEADFRIVPDAGHSAFEPGNTNELVSATDRFATRRG